MRRKGRPRAVQRKTVDAPADVHNDSLLLRDDFLDVEAEHQPLADWRPPVDRRVDLAEDICAEGQALSMSARRGGRVASGSRPTYRREPCSKPLRRARADARPSGRERGAGQRRRGCANASDLRQAGCRLRISHCARAAKCERTDRSTPAFPRWPLTGKRSPETKCSGRCEFGSGSTC